MTLRILRIVLFILVPLILLIITSSWIMEWLWLRELGYTEVFRVLKSTQLLLFSGTFFLSGIYLVSNFRWLARQMGPSRFVSILAGNLNIAIPPDRQQKWIRRAFTGAAIGIALIFAFAIMIRWDDTLRFFWSQPMGAVDPVFGKEISFYMFQLPILNLLQSSLAALTFFTTFLLAVLYFATDMISARPGQGFRAHPAALIQIKINMAIWLLALSAGFFLSRYELLFRADGVVFGAGYTHVVIELPALWAASGLTALLAVLLIASRWISLNKILAGVAGLIVLTLLVGRLLLPTAIQQFRVNPYELEIERPYIERNIEMTRLSYGFDRIREIDYPADDTLRADDIRNNQNVIENIRLWDPRLLIQTYRQLQEIRPYYQFNAVNIDRYIIDGRKQQVMLAGRELAPQLPDASNTWVNRHLQYTHGFGVAMSPVNLTNSQGEPVMLARDLPPVTHPDIDIRNAAIYYGMENSGYYIVNTETEELHYPSGDANVYHNYSGNGGIPFRSWLYRLLFAWELGEINILLSDYITPESRIQIWRGVQDRINRITPFLVLDEDPYLVVHDGRLVWIQDAYTTSSKFPYSDPHGSINYIRNPVKIVVDAYEGSVDYYVVDDSDPIIRIYSEIFPNLFQPAEAVPEGLAEHFRYPVNLFEVQLEKYNRYHMVNPRVFYNDEDRWQRPFEQYGGQRMLMEPYYVLGRLPGDNTNPDELEFKLISPLTPQGRNNMIAWMAARSDPAHYGELVTYRLPKDRLIFGPAQIESRIDQDPEISRQLALWDQRGSRVIRGNLLVVPIENSFMYVEPVFLLAERDDIPQLQRVIVAVGNDISMQPTIQAAMIDLFGDDADFLDTDVAPVSIPDEEELISAMDEPLPVQEPEGPTMEDMTSRELEEIRTLWRDLRQAMNDGNWARYGELLEDLDSRLEE
ncbi:MAG: UPF0182 family protein [Balneolales bacterium]